MDRLFAAVSFLLLPIIHFYFTFIPKGSARLVAGKGAELFIITVSHRQPQHTMEMKADTQVAPI